MRKLYHCAGARSMRSVWLLHELGLDFELVSVGFSMAALPSWWIDINVLTLTYATPI